MGTFQFDKLRNVVVQFKLPVAFDLLNSTEKDSKGNPYLVQIDGIPVLIKTKRVYDFRWKEDFQLAEFSKIDEDRSGILSYSIIQVWFDEQMINSGKIEKDKLRILTEQFVQLSIQYLNKFINIYRSVSSQFWIRNLIRNDIFTYQYFLIDSDDNVESIFQLATKGSISFNGGEEFQIEDEKEKRLRHYLLEHYYGFKNDMVALVLDNFHLGRYNLALIQGATLFIRN